MSKETNSSGGIGLLGILGIVFVTLKLTGHIDWSWWWVTMPFWGVIALALVILFFFVTVPAIAMGIHGYLKQRK